MRGAFSQEAERFADIDQQASRRFVGLTEGDVAFVTNNPFRDNRGAVKSWAFDSHKEAFDFVVAYNGRH